MAVEVRAAVLRILAVAIAPARFPAFFHHPAEKEEDDNNEHDNRECDFAFLVHGADKRFRLFKDCSF